LEGSVSKLFKKNINNLMNNSELNRINLFSIQLNRFINKLNIIINPFNIYKILSLLSSITSNELLKIVQQPSDELIEFNTISSSHINALFIENKYINNINNSFIDLYERAIGSVESYHIGDHTISSKINNHIRKTTNGIISNVIEPIMLDGISIIDATYIRVLWKHKFDHYHTKLSTFHPQNVKDDPDTFGDKKVHMMYRIDTCKYFSDKLCQHIELYCNDPDTTFGIFLPRNASGLYNNYLTNIGKLSEQRIAIYIPRIRAIMNIDLVPILTRMGLKNIFDAHLAGNKGCFIARFKHECVLIADESGGEDDIVTIASKEDDSMTMFRADHTFIYYIRYKGIIMFQGIFNSN
jgi:serine protease inhibitor